MGKSPLLHSLLGPGRPLFVNELPPDSVGSRPFIPGEFCAKVGRAVGSEPGEAEEGGSQFAWFANLPAVRGAKVGWMEYLPLAATAMLVSPPHLGSIQGLMANLAQEYYLKIDIMN